MKEIYISFFNVNFPTYKLKIDNYTIEAKSYNIRILITLVGKGYSICEIYDSFQHKKMFNGQIRSCNDIKSIFDMRKIENYINEKSKTY